MQRAIECFIEPVTCAGLNKGRINTMLKMSFKLNGRTIPSNCIAAELTKQIQTSATELARRRIQSIRCPVHRQKARVISIGARGRFRVTGCCDRLIAEAHRNLQ